MIFLIAIMLFSFAEQIIGGQKPEVRILTVDLPKLSPGILFYSGKKDVHIYRDMGVSCSYGAAFVPLNKSLGEYVNPGGYTAEEDLSEFQEEKQEQIKASIAAYDALSDEVRDLRVLPLFLLQKRQSDGTLCTIKINDALSYTLALKNEQSQELIKNSYVIEDAVQNFNQTAHHLSKDRKLLLQQDVLQESGGECVHGRLGYFKDIPTNIVLVVSEVFQTSIQSPFVKVYEAFCFINGKKVCLKNDGIPIESQKQLFKIASQLPAAWFYENGKIKENTGLKVGKSTFLAKVILKKNITTTSAGKSVSPSSYFTVPRITLLMAAVVLFGIWYFKKS